MFVAGEPGIGKTSLVTRFVAGSRGGGEGAVGSCDDLSIPRPLGAIRDLVGTVSAPLEEALAAGAASHEIQSLLIGELALPPQPTVLVLEDVHWADDATLDSDRRARAADRLAAGAGRAHLPRRRGAAGASAARRPRGEPRRGHGLSRAGAPVGARSRLARRRGRRRGVRRDRGQPVLRQRAARRSQRRPSCRPRWRTRFSGGRLGSTTLRGGSCSWSRSSRTASPRRCWTR